MGRSVTLNSLPYKLIGVGAAQAQMTGGDVSKMTACSLRVDPQARLEMTVPAGADGYLFMLTGEGKISVTGSAQTMDTESFATIAEGNTFSVVNASAQPAELIYVLAPPPGSPREHKGLAQPLTVRSRAAAPTLYLPEQKKMRRYFVAKEAAASERGHAMIVEYEQGTETVMHHHPNAESMFVVLSGDIRFIINGEPIVLRRGQAAYFAMNDRHALRCADGTTSASFLEFHIPEAYTTIK